MRAGPSLALCALLAVHGGAAAAAERAPVPGGEFTPVVAPGKDVKRVAVAAFALDRRPVTNAEFLAFVRERPAWRKGAAPALLADGQYLRHWAGPAELGAGAGPEQPVTHVSWFAARAYCAAAGGRLPTWYEWEYVAAADETRADARQDPAFRERILAWYALPSGRPLPPVGKTPANVYGVQDLHGVIWEWVEDFGGLMVSGDSRTQGDPDKLQFCGAGALSAEIRDDYPILMRIALLSSLEANFTTANLGFRCAYGAPP
ncbi:MAG TPA: formylglycine-generating enzyme family protein [Steroidobacteraceae bacterium]|nr:formylglycine-generating enzyme family protein [Steroidobacteraceae bacterium]